MNRYPLHPHPQRWSANLRPTWIRWLRPWRQRRQHRVQRLVEIDVRGLEHLSSVVDKGYGVMITPNHAAHADSYVMLELGDQLGRPFYYMSAWQVFQLQGLCGRWLLRIHGCFSIDREGADRQAFRDAIEILQHRPHPLVIFAEGEVYHQNDRLTPFRDGAAAIALSAAKRADRPIACVPCGIKYFYIDDPSLELVQLMSRLEESIFWKPRPDLSLNERIYRFGEGLLALKEIEYLGRTKSGPLPDRIKALADHILRGIEDRYGLVSNEGGFAERVKEVRRAAIARWDELSPPEISEGDAFSISRNPPPPPPAVQEQLDQIANDLDEVFLVVQTFSYPGDYVSEHPSIERLAETLDKFEEDVLAAPTATVRARRRAVVSLGPPTIIEPGGARKFNVVDLTAEMESSVQGLLDEMSSPATNDE